MITDTLKATGSLVIVVTGPDGKIKEKREVNNLVVNIGKNHIAARVTSNANVIMSHMAVGSANVAATSGQNLLLGETSRVSLSSTSASANAITYNATFPAGSGTGTICEAGIFNAAGANAGIILCRTRFNEINKAADDVIAITWNVAIS